MIKPDRWGVAGGAGSAKVVLDLGLEVPVTINRPIAVGDRVTLALATCDPASAAFTFADVHTPPPQPEHEAAPQPLAARRVAAALPPAYMSAAAVFSPVGPPFSAAHLAALHPALRAAPRSPFSTCGRRWVGSCQV